MPEKEAPTYSIPEYLALEEVADIRNEYERGRIFAMSGGTLNHGIIYTALFHIHKHPRAS